LQTDHASSHTHPARSVHVQHNSLPDIPSKFLGHFLENILAGFARIFSFSFNPIPPYQNFKEFRYLQINYVFPNYFDTIALAEAPLPRSYGLLFPIGPGAGG
jgi:hypothetical protein